MALRLEVMQSHRFALAGIMVTVIKDSLCIGQMAMSHPNCFDLFVRFPQKGCAHLG